MVGGGRWQDVQSKERTEQHGGWPIKWWDDYRWRAKKKSFTIRTRPELVGRGGRLEKNQESRGKGVIIDNQNRIN